MRNLLISLMILPILALYACSESEGPVETEGPSVEELEAEVVENCYILRDAIEEFRTYNDGLCPVDIYADTNSVGLTVIDLLPDGQLLENPFTGLRTEPVDTIATEPGQVGYHQGHGFSGGRLLYYINGYGEHYTIVELSNLEELEEAVIANCMLVGEAVEMFATLNGGIFPSDVYVDTTPQGYTIIDLLPESTLLENPFTRARSEPVNGAAVTPGQTGYVPIVIGGLDVGFSITGSGRIAGITTFIWWQTPNDTCISVNGAPVYCTE